MKTRTHVGAALAAILLSGCGTSPASQPSADPVDGESGPLGNAAFLEQIRYGNEILIFESIAERAMSVDAVMTGTVASIEPGAPISHETGQDDFEISDEFAVVQVRIDELYRAEEVEIGGDVAYVRLPRGSRATDSQGTTLGDGPSTITPIDAFQEALPVGTRVVVLASAVNHPDGATRAQYDISSSVTSGTALLEGGPSQAFSVEHDATGHLSGWPQTTYREAVTELEQAFP